MDYCRTEQRFPNSSAIIARFDVQRRKWPVVHLMFNPISIVDILLV